MKKSKKAALAIASQIIENREASITHEKRLTIAHENFLKALGEVKWIIETFTPLLPPEQYPLAFKNVEQYRESLMALSEAELQVAEDCKQDMELYLELVHAIPEKLWE